MNKIFKIILCFFFLIFAWYVSTFIFVFWAFVFGSNSYYNQCSSSARAEQFIFTLLFSPADFLKSKRYDPTIFIDAKKAYQTPKNVRFLDFRCAPTRDLELLCEKGMAEFTDLDNLILPNGEAPNECLTKELNNLAKHHKFKIEMSCSSKFYFSRSETFRKFSPLKFDYSTRDVICGE